jgi:formate C-acetyltransferase
MTPRIEYIRDRRKDHYHEPCRKRIYDEAMAQNSASPRVIQIAEGYRAFLAKKPLPVNEYDILAGHYQFDSYESSLPLTVHGDSGPRYNGECYFDIEREIGDYLSHNGLAHDSEDARLLYFFKTGTETGLYKRWASGHSIPAYDMVLSGGLGAIAANIRGALDDAHGADEKDQLEAMLICTEAALMYIGRYAESVRTLLETSSDEHRPTLERTLNACERFAKGEAPRGFYDAVQLLWFSHELVMWENLPGSMSFGRLDQYLYPYYQKDIETGAITYAEAEEIIDALWLKISSVIEAFQNVTLGGYSLDGGDGGNPVSLMCLRASRKFLADQPLVTSRYNSLTSQEYWDECVELIRTGTGFPAMYNDDIAIEAKQSAGVSREDALNYGIVGCAEISVPGKEYARTEEYRFNWAKVMELAMSGGIDIATGEELPLRDKRELGEIRNFEDFYEWISSEFEHYLVQGIKATNMLDSVYHKNYPNPWLSCLTRGCVDSKKDVTNNGAAYSFSSANSCGNANLVNSIAAIKKLVFDDGYITLEGFAEALKDDYAGHDGLLAKASNIKEKYGNDISSVDEIMSRMTDMFTDTVERHVNFAGSRYQSGLYTVYDHSRLGECTGALPEGRRAATSLANSLAPTQGTESNGPTAALNSSMKINQAKAANGVVLDMKFLPSLFEKEKNRVAFRSLMDSYFRGGGMELQYNVISRETLLDAQEHPDQYGNLVVRVSGFSAYFTNLSRTIQNEIIARTQYSGF